MDNWIPFEEIEAELMEDPDFAEGVRLAELRLERELAAERTASILFDVGVAHVSYGEKMKVRGERVCAE